MFEHLTPIDKRIPSGVKNILRKLESEKHSAFIVGGCVRDHFLWKEPKDWDVCTSATPSEVLSCFSDQRVIKTGLKHGTVTILMDDGQYEVTTFRKDGSYSDGRHPDSVEFVQDVVIDLSRRDFSINAMAYNERLGLVDPFGGLYDLMNRILCCAGNDISSSACDVKFQDDALRIMRALRFASTLGFNISSRLSESIRRNAKRLDNIAAERINVELCKLLCGQKVTFILLNYIEVFTVIIPELLPCVGFDQNNRYHQFTVYDHIAHAVGNYAGDDVIVKLALLLHDIGKPLCYTEDEKGGHFKGHGAVSAEIAARVMKRLRFDNKTTHDVVELVAMHDSVFEPTPRVVRRLLNKIGQEQLGRLLDVHDADVLAHAVGTQQKRIDSDQKMRTLMQEILEQQQCFTLKDIAINGRDIINLGISEGRAVGSMLHSALDAVMSERVPNDRSALLQYIIDNEKENFYERQDLYDPL